jgi:ppGpp synthetase/RelA/SpoT-type nucleotidyltranferase
MPANPITLYSKTQINRAGETIVNASPHSPEYKKALFIVNDWRTCHAYPMNTFQATLRRKVSKYKSPIVAQRLKRLPTIIDKLSRYPDMSLARMQDIGGVRAVVNSIDEVRAIQAEYEDTSRFTHELYKKNDYITAPKSDGYRGVHLVFKYNNTFNTLGRRLSRQWGHSVMNLLKQIKVTKTGWNSLLLCLPHLLTLKVLHPLLDTPT